MHDIEPFFKWRNLYQASKDKASPFYGREYDEFKFTTKIYNYYIHPQWDGFGSDTLYSKVLYADYEKGFAILELIGEWNDCLYNDVMFLKRELVDSMIDAGIYKFILIGENVLNFHGDDNSYYEEWYEDVQDEDGWIAFVNFLPHVEEELKDTQIQYYCNFGEQLSDINWRLLKPKGIMKLVEQIIFTGNNQLR